MSPTRSDLTLTQVLRVFTDGEAEAQRQEWGQAWGRERDVGSPSNPGQAPASTRQGPPLRARLEAGDMYVTIHKIAHKCEMCLLCVLYGTDLWAPRNGPLSSHVGAQPGWGWLVQLSQAGEVPEVQSRDKTCPAPMTPEQVDCECCCGQAEGLGYGGSHVLGSHLGPAWPPSSPRELVGHSSSFRGSPRTEALGPSLAQGVGDIQRGSEARDGLAFPLLGSGQKRKSPAGPSHFLKSPPGAVRSLGGLDAAPELGRPQGSPHDSASLSPCRMGIANCLSVHLRGAAGPRGVTPRPASLRSALARVSPRGDGVKAAVGCPAGALTLRS